MLTILFNSIGAVFAADFITGFVHWLEDSFWSIDTPILGKWIVEPNLAHHANGQAFLEKSWWVSSWDLALTGLTVVIIAYLTHHLTLPVTIFAFLIANANQIHKWAHITRDSQKPRIVAFLQKIYVLQRTRHHGQHHRKPNNSHYCVITNVLNPLLDRTKFWRALERIAGKK